jgi:hypothetical protein
MAMEPSEFERSVLEWIVSRSDDPALPSQLLGAEIHDREYTGVGCFSRVAPPAQAKPSDRSYAARGPLHGPGFNHPAVELGGGTLLWFRDGIAECLEVFAYGDHFPEDHAELAGFTLRSDP